MVINGVDYELLRLAYLAARDHGLEPALVAGVITQESGWHAGRLGDYKDGRPTAFGLMQVNVRYGPEPVRAYADRPEALLEPMRNLALGCGYLADCVATFEGEPDGLQKAICAYNAGVGRVRRDGWIWNQDRYVGPVLASGTRWRPYLVQVATLAHVDAVYGHLQEATAELVALKRVVGLE